MSAGLRLVLVLLPLSVPALLAQRTSFDVATFDPPARWERLPGSGPMGFRSPDRTSQIFLFPSRETSGNGSSSSLEDHFRVEWTRLVEAPFGTVPLPKPNIERRPDGWTAASGAARLGNGGAQSVLLYAAMDAEGKRLFRIVSTIGSGAQNQSALAAFFSTLALQRGVADAAAGPLNGLYFAAQASAVSGGRLEARTRFFLPGSRIARVFPFGSGDSFDAAARCSPDTCGAYTLGAGQLITRWDNGQVDRIAYEPVAGGEGIRLDGTLYKQARPVPAVTLAGAWAGAGQTGVASTNVYRFQPDGQFTFGTTASRGLDGRYSVQGMTLVLTFSDGDIRRYALFAAASGGAGGSTSMLCIDGEMFVRQ